MPEFVIKEEDSKIKVVVYCVMRLDGDVDLAIRNLSSGESNGIAHLRRDGTMSLYSLGVSWAKDAGIKTDNNGKIQLRN